MRYEDLEKARVERAIKEQAKAKGKGKRGRKPKNAVLESTHGISLHGVFLGSQGGMLVKLLLEIGRH